MNFDKLKKIVEDTLQVNVQDEFSTLLAPCATIEQGSDMPVLFGNGKCQEESEGYYITLYYRTREERDVGRDKMKKVLTALYGSAECVNSYDNVGRLWKTMFPLTILKENE